MHGSIRQSTGHRRWGRYILCSSLRASSSFYRPAFVSAFSLDGKLIAWCVGAPRCRWIGRAPPFGAANPSRHLRSSVSPPSGRTARHMRTASATLHQDGNTVTRCAFPGSAREHTGQANKRGATTTSARPSASQPHPDFWPVSINGVRHRLAVCVSVLPDNVVVATLGLIHTLTSTVFPLGKTTTDKR
jgi:hypothetical protein